MATLELDGLLNVLGESIEDGVQDTADLAGCDQVDVELIKDFGVLAK